MLGLSDIRVIEGGEIKSIRVRSKIGNKIGSEVGSK
jgi:hypothetical protein